MSKEKLSQNYTLHLDKATSEMIEKLSQFYERKPAEFLRLILVPVLSQYWAKMETIKHEENTQKMTLATFKNDGADFLK